MSVKRPPDHDSRTLVCRLVAFAFAFAFAFVAGCGPSLAAHAERVARTELRCAPPGLRVRAVGELRGAPPAAPVVQVFDAEGCDAERRYFCARDARGGARCAPALEALVPADHAAGLARALRLLRTTARGRCPGETLRVVQESASLFRFEACDGVWTYHCRARGCERLR